jgi:hypothetical protein
MGPPDLGTGGGEVSQLTEELKADIDSLSYQALLSRWRFAPIGH